MLTSLIYGINTVLSAVESKRAIKVFISKSFSNERIIEKLRCSGVTLEFVEKEIIFSLVGKSVVSQGIVAEVKEYTTFSLEELITSLQKKEKSIILMLDGIEDPHNFGAILRVCDAFDVDAVIYKKNNQVGITETVAKVSTGAINYVKMVSVVNLSNTIKTLKELGFWIYASDGGAKDTCYSTSFANKTVLILGSEGFGVSRLVKENSDHIIKIPMYGHVNSLNASTAAAILLSEIKRQLI
ncbi:MAG: 23S rRNA (guanosine(2251)-2'-O)-methyltransferase RlmB [Bacilli bacterium]